MIRISHKSGILRARIHLPTSKSLSNRALIIRFLSGKTFPIHRLSLASDTQVLRELLDTLPQEMDVGDAGTSLRFLTAALALTPGKWKLTGSRRLQERPLQILVDALRTLGAEIRCLEKEGFAPLSIEGKKLSGGSLEIDASVSSQYLSSLLMIAPRMRQGLRLLLKGPVASLPYIRMTLQLMQHFGVKHVWEDNEIFIPQQEYQHAEYAVETDWSGASYWFEAAALARQAEVLLEGLTSRSLQGDAALVSLMEPFGVKCSETPEGLLLLKSSKAELSRLYEADCRATPDLVPALLATAAGLKTEARISGIENLNLKESRRSDVLVEEFRRNGVKIQADTHSIHLQGGELNAMCQFHVHLDHRMAMCFAPLSLVTGDVVLDDSSVIGKSYPDYWKQMEKAGFDLI